MPGTGFPPLSVARTVRTMLEPETVADESLEIRTSIDAAPAVPVAWKVADVEPAIATVRTFVRAVSLIFQVFVTLPVASATDVGLLTTPFPVAVDQLTVTPAAGAPFKVTLAATLSVDPTVAVCTARAESGAML